VALLTPIVKAWLTDRGVAIASLGIQVHGGMGYVEETGAAQFLRDIRISPIYEGTNGIQAIDLVLRKLTLANGVPVASLLEEVEETATRLAGVEPGLASALAAALVAGREATDWLQSRMNENEYDDALAGATPYLDLMGTLAGGWLMARSWLEADRMLSESDGDSDFLTTKKATAAFYLTQLLPKANALVPAVTAGVGPLATF
jgi:3-(methylthio)propanoyl-CoA dehydrogenase